MNTPFDPARRESGRGLPQSKTLTRFPVRVNARSVLECGSPLPLSSPPPQPIVASDPPP